MYRSSPQSSLLSRLRRLKWLHAALAILSIGWALDANLCSFEDLRSGVELASVLDGTPQSGNPHALSGCAHCACAHAPAVMPAQLTLFVQGVTAIGADGDSHLFSSFHFIPPNPPPIAA